jgi:hypothetical protein
VLVTGDPPVNLSSLAAALTEATAGKHTVLAIACGGEFNEQELRRAAGPSPLILFLQVRASECQRRAGNSTHHLANHVFSSVKGGGGLRRRPFRVAEPRRAVGDRPCRFEIGAHLGDMPAYVPPRYSTLLLRSLQRVDRYPVHDH